MYNSKGPTSKGFNKPSNFKPALVKNEKSKVEVIKKIKKDKKV